MTNDHSAPDSPDDLATAGGLLSAYQPIPETEAAAILAARYGVNGRLQRMATEKDDTFRVIADTGQRWVLKIANGGEDPASIDLQNACLARIAATDPSLPVPRVLADCQGRNLCPLPPGPDGSIRLARVLSYIDGTPLDATVSTAAERGQIGRVLARLRLAMAGFSHPAENRLLAWDIQHLMRLTPFLQTIPDPEQKRMLRDGLDRFSRIESALPGLRRQVLHNDFSKSNIIVDHADPAFVCGIIDFGDTVRTAIAIDVATAMMNQLPATADAQMFDAPADLLAGYLVLADLTRDEIALLPHLIMARVITRALITIRRAQLFPDNAPYIIRNTGQTWHQLQWFLDRAFDKVSATLTG